VGLDLRAGIWRPAAAAPLTGSVHGGVLRSDPSQRVPNLQVSGQVLGLLTSHVGFPIPSPAMLEKIGLRFRRAVDGFAAPNDIPVIRFTKGERELAVMRPHLDRLARAGGCGGGRDRGWPKSSSACSPAPPILPSPMAVKTMRSAKQFARGHRRGC